jgi:cell division protein FtsQ
MAFASMHKNDFKTHLEIQIINNEFQYFLTEQELMNRVASLYDSIENVPIEEINIAMLEDTLESLTYVENAEVFSTLDGKLSIVVNQNKAIARIYDGNNHYYLNSKGETMPLSRNYSAMVPLVTGNVKQEQLQYTHQLLLKSINDPFYHNIITGIDYKTDDIKIYTALGKHQITWGDTTATSTKMEKLKLFYQSLEEDELKSLKTVNVTFKDQVVFTN